MAIKITNRQDYERAKNFEMRRALDVVAALPTPELRTSLESTEPGAMLPQITISKAFARPCGRPPSATAKIAVTLRLDPKLVAAYQAMGPYWRARMAARLED